ncbi:hypothetical protein PI124_g2475 [Phytophthora idaei]|nr:hypothetical protein PI125_g2097 [Phytophthora idaei]KAG3171419.1 hypothetical protein PI126_g1906 [Phytophthora idaei]KAG3252942.1 hypothetical protein PI124_g2475 [Phytophthora idaei]
MEKALMASKQEELGADCSDSTLEGEQCCLFVEMLYELRDLFVESSKKPGRTDLLKFRIDTGT